MKYLPITLTAIVTGFSLWWGLHSEEPQIREWDLVDRELPTMNIALLSDFHFSDPKDLKDLATIKRQMLNYDIDLVLFAGDFIGSPTLYRHITRKQIVQALEALAYPATSFAVLGNHDNWDSRTEWISAFSNSSIELVENRIATFNINKKTICIRGLGDYYSGYLSSTKILQGCDHKTITLTHDPAGLIEDSNTLGSISFAGHTHCGQIAFPFIGAPLVPTTAPKELQCGRFDRGYAGIVSGGLGTSILPVRFGPRTEPGWELVRIQHLK